MGGICKLKMPLLSTLAALVILVHSAEENYEQDYRQIRPRALDVAPSSYDQSWRAIEVEPATMQPPQRNQERWDEESPDQPMRRRRRKRKRRPNQEDITPQEEFLYREASQAQQQDVVEMPRRRRKKGDNNQDSRERIRPTHWNEDGLERPLRRRGQRRKRPPIDSWPKLSEFNDFRQPNRPDNSDEINEETRIDSNVYDNRNNNDKNERIESKIQFYDHSESQFVEITTKSMKGLENEPVSQKDISLSEFSVESKRSEKILSSNVEKETENIKDKSIISSNVIETPEVKEPLDPQTLKAILKKSNGKSLSEILQRNNLSLADLLHGKERALSVLKRKDVIDSQETDQFQKQIMNFNNDRKLEDKVDKVLIDRHDRERLVTENSSEENDDLDTTTDCSTSIETTTTIHNSISSQENLETTEKNKVTNSRATSNNSPTKENTTNYYLRRRFPASGRRRLRMRPPTNTTYKGQLSRDLITLNSMKYRNRGKSKEWKDILPIMMKRGQAVEESIAETDSNNVKITTTTFVPEETTTEQILETTTDPSDVVVNTESSFYTDIEKAESLNAADSKGLVSKTEIPTTVTANEDAIKEVEVEVEKPKTYPILRPLVNSSELRRQAYNNRLKRKRLKQRVSTTEHPDENGLRDIYGTSNYVSASEFIAKTRTTQAEQEDYSTLEDFMTTETSKSTESEVTRSTKTTPKIARHTSTTQVAPITTGETAKYEIEEILNDDLASARLSKILKERNMTIMELVEHRERGSSHVHLADIFHNASKEPNPPEPFLSKSLIEPISKETYPLRALLEASSHDAKTTTIDPNLIQNNNLNIPVVMDFGNNVNENGENMGIISLFNNFSRIASEGQGESNEKETIEVRSDEIVDIKNQTTRESRVLRNEKDLLSWNDLINLMQKNHQKDSTEDGQQPTDDPPTTEIPKKVSLEQDNDVDGLLVLEDLQRLKDFNSRITSDELLEIKVFESNENQKPTTDSVLISNTKSVTVATASIIGLALILFLLTYAILKWRQQNKIYHNNHSKEDEHVPTPIFENRKGLKINSSTRSKSPMLASSNIYTVESIDRAGSESPEYMWDTLRKPFQ